MISTLKGVNAGVDTMNEHYKPIPDVYIWKKDPTGQRVAISHQMSMIVKNSNNQFVYCIEPGVSIDGTDLYTAYSTDQAYVSGMTEQQWKRIELLAYYGYNYVDEVTDHTDIKWYAVTQFMIWQTVPHGYNIYFSTSIHKDDPIEKYTDEQKEMERLIKEHETVPHFASLDLTLGETKTIKDDNEVLSHFKLSSNTSDNIKKEENNLIITANEIGKQNFSLLKADDIYQHGAIVYLNPKSQDVVEVGSYPTIKTAYEYNVTGAELIFQKFDFSSNRCQSKGTAEIKGAVYGLYKKDGTLVMELTTDEHCAARTGPILGVGEYYVKEIKNPKGYLIDFKTYSFTVTSETKSKNIVVYDNYKTSKLKVSKVEKGTAKKIHLAKIGFKIYDTIENKYICETSDCIYYTNENGEFVTKGLYPSTYRLEEIEGSIPGFLWNSTPLEFTVTEDSPEQIELSFENETVKGGIHIHKNSEYGFPIEGVIFEVLAKEDIYDVDNTILYHAGDVVATLTTNEEGNTSISGIPLGKYIIKEVETKEGYFLPDQEFEVDLKYQDEHTPTIEETLTIINYQVPNTKKNSIFIPLGFISICLGGIFLYENKKSNHSLSS